MAIQDAISNISDGADVDEQVDALLDESALKTAGAAVGGAVAGVAADRYIRKRKVKKRMKEIAHMRWANKTKPVHPKEALEERRKKLPDGKLYRTSMDKGHMHRAEVDDNGNGVTLPDTTVHSHRIVGWRVLRVAGHTHNIIRRGTFK